MTARWGTHSQLESQKTHWPAASSFPGGARV